MRGIFVVVIVAPLVLAGCDGGGMHESSTQTSVTSPSSAYLVDADRTETGGRAAHPLPGTIRSARMRSDYRIDIGLPASYEDAPDRTYPVVYLLDGDWYFDGTNDRLGDGGVAAIVRQLHDRGAMPEAIVVAVGYPGVNTRGRDFLVDTWAFYGFLTDELFPLVDEQYRTDPSAGRTLIGHSDGAYMAVYTLMQSWRPDTPAVRNVIALSGDYSKNGGALSSAEAELARRVGDGATLPLRVFMAVGGREEARFRSSAADIEETLTGRGYRDFALGFVEYPQLDHGTIVSRGIRSGLGFVFATADS